MRAWASRTDRHALRHHDLRDARFELEIAETVAALAGVAHLLGDPEDALAQFGEHGQRELRPFELVGDLLVAAQDCLGGPSLQVLVALGVENAKLLHGALDARRDLAGLLVAHRLGELRPGVREGAQVVPAVDDVAGGAGDPVERAAQGGRRGFELLGEVDLFLATQRPRAADLLEVGLQRAALAAGIEILGREGRRGAQRATRLDLGRRGRLPILQLHE